MAVRAAQSPATGDVSSWHSFSVRIAQRPTSGYGVTFPLPARPAACLLMTQLGSGVCIAQSMMIHHSSTAKQDAQGLRCALLHAESPPSSRPRPREAEIISLGSVKYHLVSATSQKHSDGLLTNSNPPRDLTVGMSSEIEILKQLRSQVRQRTSPAGIAGGPAQRRQSAILEASLVSAHSACGTAKSLRHVALACQVLLH